MDDYDYTPFEDEPAPRKPRPTGFRLPGGLSLQAAAAVLLVAVSLAALYLIFGPTPDEGEVVAPATNTPAAALVAVGGTPSAATTVASPAGATSASTAAGGTIAPAGSATAPLAAAAAPTALAPMSGLATSPSPASAPAGGPLAMDGFARVAGTDAYGLRLRFGAGLDTATIRWADEGEVLRVVGGPLTEDGETWWRVQDALGNTGWAAATYLSPAAAPPAWAPPIASPTFDASAADLDDGPSDEGITAPVSDTLAPTAP